MGRRKGRGVIKAHLILRFDAPLTSFGGVAVDNYGPIDPFPSASLLTGLLGNALGMDRSDGRRLQALQDRLVYAARIDQPGHMIMDFQTAALARDDKGWTTHGVPEGRSGGAGTYKGKHIRYRDYWADRIVTVALRLAPPNSAPSLGEVADALQAPIRPLFIGRKPCLPSTQLLVETVEAKSALSALEKTAVTGDAATFEAFWSEDDSEVLGQWLSFETTGRRNWISGVHGGSERWRRGTIKMRPAP